MINNKIQTRTGKFIDPLDPDPDMICIEDIAWALMNICRYTGHTNKFYSVAEHSTLVAISIYNSKSFFATRSLCLTALLHDASEAYLSDISSPVKHRLPDYVKAESRLMSVIADVFGFEYPLPDIVLGADRQILRYEVPALMNVDDDDLEKWNLPECDHRFQPVSIPKHQLTRTETYMNFISLYIKFSGM